MKRNPMVAIGRFMVSSPKPFIVLLIGGLCGILWQPLNRVAIVIFLILTALAIIDAIAGIVVDIRHGHVGVDILAIIAILATTVVGEYWAAWVVILMIYSGDAIEDFAQAKARQNLTALMDAAPQIAHVLRSSSSAAQTSQAADLHAEGWDTVPVDTVRVGDHFVVKPGETVPVNGVLLSDQATVDLSMINGEPVPVDVLHGGRISSGAINGSDTLTMQATATAQASQYQKILQLVKTAQESRATIVKTADMLAVPFTVISLVIAFLAWYVSGDPLRFAQVLVLATPCPLLITAPVAYLGGTGRLAKRGVIIKTQDVLENLGNVTHLFFDKTGTLTSKRPAVSRVDLLEQARKNYTDDDILTMSGPLEAYSVHILAKGISAASSDLTRAKNLPRPRVENAREEPGNGTSGVVNGHDVKVGRLLFVAPDTADPATLFTPLAPNEMVAYVSIDGMLAGRIVLSDFARKNSATAISRLKKLGITRLTMLTGDNLASATAIGDDVGIDDIRAHLLPEDKVEALKEARKDDLPAQSRLKVFLRRLGGGSQPAAVTMMVGDGVNDAPVLASASIGVAITDGSSTAASESAHVVIMNDDIEMVPTAIAISRQTKRTMLQAVLSGLAIAIILMVLAAFNFIPVVLGALLQVVIDVFSILFGLAAIIEKKID